MVALDLNHENKVQYARWKIDSARIDFGEPRQKDSEEPVDDLWVWQDRYLSLNRIYDLIMDLDDMIQSDIMADRIPYSDALEAKLVDLITLWLSLQDRYLPHLERMEVIYGRLEVGDEYRRRVQEAKAVLTDDEIFFSGPQLAFMEQMAIDDDAAGLTDEYTICPNVARSSSFIQTQWVDETAMRGACCDPGRDHRT